MGRPVITKPGLYPDIDEDVRQIRIDDDHVALINGADRRLVAGLPWRLMRGHNGKLYAYARIGSLTVYMHRLIAGTAPEDETDHENGDGLDNRRSNLRTATRSQNKGNMGKPKRPDGSAHMSRYKGVTRDRRNGAWIAKIGRNGISRYIGRYADEADAARAYDAAAIEHFGEFARLNFPVVAK